MKRRRKKKRRIHPDTVTIVRQIIVGLFTFALLGLIVAGVWYGTRMDAVTIDTVSVSGGETIPHDMVRERAAKKLEGTYFGLIPRRFTFMYPHDDILVSLADIPRVRDMMIHRVNKKEVHITLEEYQADALWCQSDGKECVFLDENGFAFADAPMLEGSAFNHYVTSGRIPETGHSVALPDEYKNAEDLLVRLAEQGWYIDVIDVDTAADAYLQIVGGGELKVSLKDTAEGTINNLLAVIASPEFTEIGPGNFKYIDLRFGNKVFVNQELTPEAGEDVFASSTATTTDTAE